jgi:hypothetical protein
MDPTRISKLRGNTHSSFSIPIYVSNNHGREIDSELEKRLFQFFNYLKEHRSEVRYNYKHYKYDVYLMSSFYTRLEVFYYYEEFVHNKSCSYSYFLNVWKRKFKELIISKSATDVCGVCKLVSEMKEIPSEEAKSIVLMEEHSKLYRSARQYYNKCISENSSKLLCFDKSESVRLPRQRREDSKLFFKSGRQVQIFGVCDMSINLQYNYITDESEICSGSDVIISYVFDYLIRRQVEKRSDLVFFCDNTCSQNKNKSMLNFLSMLVYNDFVKSIELCFMEPGHTKFSCDAHFGMIKKELKRSDVFDKFDLADCVRRSSQSNDTVMIRDHDGELQVPVYNWSEYFAPLDSIPNLTDYCHFKFLGNFKILVRRNFMTDKFHEIQLNRRSFETSPHIWKTDPLKYLKVKKPQGLSQEREIQIFKDLAEHNPNSKKHNLFFAPKPACIPEGMVDNLNKFKKRIAVRMSEDPPAKKTKKKQKSIQEPPKKKVKTKQ